MKKFITFCLMTLTMLSCSSVGWIKKDKKTNTGTFVYKDGSIYTGGYLDKKFSGNGRFVYGNNSYKSAGFTIYNDIPNVLTDCSYTGVFENGIIKQNSHIVFIKKAINSTSRENFTYEGNYAHGGFEGKGILHFFDGLIVEGNFSNETTTYSSMYCCVYYYPKINWNDNNMIGSKISGQCKMTWPNGTVFTGTIYDYYLFNRAYLGVDHFYPNREFIGVGILKVPGKKDYQGCFKNNGETITPITEKDMISSISYFEKNTYSIALARERNGQDVRESDNAKKGQEEEKKASDWLRNEMADLPKKFKIQQEEADAISRGTTVAAEKAKALRDAAFYEAVERHNASAGNSNSESNTNSNTSNTNTGTASNGSNSSNGNPNSGTKSQSSNSSNGGTASNGNSNSGSKSQSSNSSKGTASNGSTTSNQNSSSGNSSNSSTGNISPIVLHTNGEEARNEEYKKQQENERIRGYEENKKNEEAIQKWKEERAQNNAEGEARDAKSKAEREAWEKANPGIGRATPR